MTCYAMESEYESGVRFIPVRRTQGVCGCRCTSADGAEVARRNWRARTWPEGGREWLIGVAEVDLRIVALHPVAELAPAGVA